MSWSSHPNGNGFAVTVNTTGLLEFMLGATETTRYPEVAPVGIVIVMEVAVQASTVATIPFRSTMLLPCDAPKFCPLMTTRPPIEPVVPDTLVMTGLGFAVELMETLSKVAVVRPELPPLVTARPT